MTTETNQTSWKPIMMMLAAFIVPMLALSGYAWLQLPDGARIPTHWNIHGDVDGYASKGFGLFFLPGLLIVLIPAIVFITRLDPRRAHVAQSWKFLTIVLGGVMVVMAGVHAAMVLICLGHKVPMDLVAMTLVGGLFAVMGNYMGKVRSNFFMGVRTPWTLSSELSWNKTHRLAGRLFMGTGVLTVVLAWALGGTVATIAMMVGLWSTVIVSVTYSYLVWKKDPLAHAKTPETPAQN